MPRNPNIMDKADLVFQFREFSVEIRDTGDAWEGELYEADDSRAAHAFTIDVRRSLENMIGAYNLPDRMELARVVATEVHRHKHPR
jgi:hypothetical protein